MHRWRRAKTRRAPTIEQGVRALDQLQHSEVVAAYSDRTRWVVPKSADGCFRYSLVLRCVVRVDVLCEDCRAVENRPKRRAESPSRNRQWRLTGRTMDSHNRPLPAARDGARNCSQRTFERQVSGEQTEAHFGSCRPIAVLRSALVNLAKDEPRRAAYRRAICGFLWLESAMSSRSRGARKSRDFAPGNGRFSARNLNSARA